MAVRLSAVDQHAVPLLRQTDVNERSNGTVQSRVRVASFSVENGSNGQWWLASLAPLVCPVSNPECGRSTFRSFGFTAKFSFAPALSLRCNTRPLSSKIRLD